MSSPHKDRPVALITGGAKRIGQALAVFLSDCGYEIALHHHLSKPAARATQKEIQGRGGVCEIFSCDLCNELSTAKLVPTVIKKMRRLDLLINNASLFLPDSIQSETLANFTDNFNVNLRAPYILINQYSRTAKGGHVINILDANFQKNTTANFSYLLSKKALAELTLMAAASLAPNFRVNAVAPGVILPPKNKREQYLKKLIGRVPLKDKGSPQMICQAVKFLLGNTYYTGQVLFIDGGLHLG